MTQESKTMAEHTDRFDELNAREQELILRYAETLDPYNSALAAGYERSVARTVAYSWFKQPHMKPAFYETAMFRRAERMKDFKVEAAELMRRQWLIATADPKELIDLVTVGCRHCWGEGFRYQWKEHEFEAAVARAENPKPDEKPGPFPEWLGGMGFDSTCDPNPECPYCDGKGHEEIRPKDQRDLSEAGQALLKGVKVTKNGLEVMMHDQQAAARLFAELAGYKIDRKELSGPGGVPLGPTTITTTDPNEAAKIYAEMIKGPK